MRHKKKNKRTQAHFQQQFHYLDCKFKRYEFKKKKKKNGIEHICLDSLMSPVKVHYCRNSPSLLKIIQCHINCSLYDYKATKISIEINKQLINDWLNRFVFYLDRCL